MIEEMRNREGVSRKGLRWSAGNHAIDVRPKNWLTPVVLLTLREKSSYGYELMDRIAEFGFEEINAGTLYRAMRNMERDGLCEAKWEPSKECGPACRVYSVTKAGEAYLRSWAEGCKKYQKVLDAFHLAYNTACAARRPLGAASS